MSRRLRHVCAVTAAAALLAVVGLAAQIGDFSEGDEGQLWTLRQTISAANGSFPDGVFPAGVAFYNGSLFVSDRENRQILVFDPNGNPFPPSPTADWRFGQAEEPSSPVYGWAPNQLTTASVNINGAPVDTPAILVSDGEAERAYAFDTLGNHLFTISLDRPAASPTGPVAINGLALSGKFILTTTNPPTLELQGIFAASWAVSWGQGPDLGAVLTYRDLEYEYTAESEFYADPTQELIGTEGEDVAAKPAKEPYGLTFDAAGNLYTVDAVTERLNAYKPLDGGGFDHLFTFGTPVTDGTTSEFYQSYGMAYWADGPGGARLFVADAINNRVLVYRPDLTPGAETLDYLFTVDGLGALDGFPFAVAIDPLSGRLAVTDDLWSPPRVWILQTSNLAAFNLQVVDAANNPIEVLCSGNSALDNPPQNYKVRFSVTVPARRPDVVDVEPQLFIDNVEYTGQSFASTLLLRQLEVVSYEYSLTAPDDGFVGSIAFKAGATATSTTDVLFQDLVLPVSDCPTGNQPPTISASPAPGFAGPQVSGWTPVFQDELYTIRLRAQDDAGISKIEYELTGANQPPGIDPVEFECGPDTCVDVQLVEMGDTAIRFRAWDSNNVSSGWQPPLDEPPFVVRLVSVPDRRSQEGDEVPSFSVGPPSPGFTYGQTGLPDGLSFDTSNGVISGTLSDQSAGEHTVTISESNGTNTSSVAFTWTVDGVNRPPVANDDSYSTNEDTTITRPVSELVSNDTDPESDPLTPVLVSGPSHGTLTFDSHGSFTYSPAPDFYGSDSFTYKVSDGSHDSAPATVTITINEVNDAPSFTPGADQSVDEDAGAQTVSGWATDISAGPPNESTQTLTFQVVSNSNPGLFSAQPAIASDGTLTYQAAANASGSATITVRLTDSGGTANQGIDASASETFTITVSAVNDAPTAVNDSYSTNEDTVLTVPAPGVLGNDTDGESAPLAATLVSDPSHGTVVLAADGSFVYTPAANFNGSDSFTYKANDGFADSNVATVTITINAVNDAPSFTAGPNQVVAEDAGAQSVSNWATAISAGPSDESSQTLTFVVVSNTNTALFSTQPAIASNGTLTYQSAANLSGTATITVRLMDNGGTANGGVNTSTSQTFTINVTPVNDAPVAANDSYSTGEDTALVVPATSGVLKNDSDADSPALTANLVAGPSHGTLVLNPDGSFAYTPTLDFHGSDSFTYKASDGASMSNTATVTITVVPSNLPPVCNAAVTPTIVWPPNHKPVYLSVSGITDPEGGTVNVTYTILQDEPTDGPGQGNTPQDGGVDANGRVWVRAERSGTGDGRVYLVSYTATDAFLASCTGVFTVSVPHDQSGAPAVPSPGRWSSMTGQQVSGFLPPNAVNDAVTVKKGQAQTISVLSNDIANGQPLTVAIVTAPTIGVATVNPNGTITYQPPPGVTGTTSFTYQVTTPSGGTDTATVAVTLKK
jgi:VCBS repeat-containing protein